jgi:hypothetical protein
MPHNWQGLYDLQMILYLLRSDPAVLAKVLNEAIQNIDSCMKTITVLSVNIDKTNYVIFQSKQKKSIQDLSLLIDDKWINRKQQIKLLGVLLDENLSWKPLINYVCYKISKPIVCPAVKMFCCCFTRSFQNVCDAL